MLTGNRSGRGQVLIIFVFAIIGLVAATGLAIDGGNIFSDRRHAQNAADTAALAGAVEKIKDQKAGLAGCTDLVTPTLCGGYVANAALNMAGDNGYKSDAINNTVEVHIPPIDGPYSNCSTFAFNCRDYIQVIINTNVNTWFARVLGIGQLHNRVEAVALARYTPGGPLYGGDSLVELKPYNDGSCNGDFIIGGNGTIILNGGGIFVNSSNTCSAYREGSNCPTVQLNNGASIQVVGTVNTTGCTQPPSPITQATTQYPYPPDPPPFSSALIPPPACNQTPLPPEPDPNPALNGFTDFYPGYYDTLPPTKNSVLEPGVYCLGSLQKITNSYTLYGNNVFLYLKPSTATNPLDITGGLIQLTSPTTGPYAGFLMYVDTNNFNYHPNCTINGGSNDTFQGIIYAPACAMTINGTSSPTGYSSSQIIAYTLKLNGTNTLTFTTSGNKFTTPELDLTGLFH